MPYVVVSSFRLRSVQCSNAAAQRWYNVNDPAYGYVAVNFQNPGGFDISSLGRFR